MYVNVTHCTHIGWIIILIFISMKVSLLVSCRDEVHKLSHTQQINIDMYRNGRQLSEMKVIYVVLKCSLRKITKRPQNNFFTLSFSTLSHSPIQSNVFACTHYKIIISNRRR